MTTQRSFLFGYRLLLQLYPDAFRRRFASEMLELAEAAEPTEWPLIFGDTSVAIIRCWFEGTRSAAVIAEPNAYLSLGGPPFAGWDYFRVLSYPSRSSLVCATSITGGHLLAHTVLGPRLGMCAVDSRRCSIVTSPRGLQTRGPH